MNLSEISAQEERDLRVLAEIAVDAFLQSQRAPERYRGLEYGRLYDMALGPR